MKKYLLLYLCILLFPLKVLAAEPTIKNISLDGSSSISVGDTLPLNFRINFSDLSSGRETILGVYAFNFELNFDSNIFIPSSIESNLFNVMIYKEDNKYYIYGEVNGQSDTGCASNIIMCGDILVNLSLYVKNTTLANTTFKMREVEVDLLEIIDGNIHFTENDLKKITSTNEAIQQVIINQTTGSIADPPKDITSNEIKKSIDTAPKSNNAYLKELIIDNYDIDFTKESKNYTIYIDDAVNTLTITAIAEDEKATLEIIGAENLQANNYKVMITVKAEDGTAQIYIITAKIKQSKDDEENIAFSLKKFLNKHKKLLIISGTSTLLIIILILAIRKFKDRDIDNLLKKL